VICCTCFNI